MICQGLALKNFRLQMSYTNEISNGDPVIKMKALNILKVHNYLFRAHKKVSLLTNCCDFKELLQKFEEYRLVNL